MPHARWITAWFLLPAVVTLIACDQAPVVDQTPEERVAERAEARWNAMIEGDWQEAYALLTPGYRESTPFNRWRGRIGTAATWKSVTVQDIVCAEDDLCQVTVLLDYEVSFPRFGVENRPGRRPLAETWLLVDGEWWHYPQR